MAQVTTINLTETEFLNREISVWGVEYVDSLLERGYEPKLTTRGWTWILPVRERVLISRGRS